MNKIIMTASTFQVTEIKSSPRYMTVPMRMFSTRVNRNNNKVTEAFIDNIIENKDDYICMPLCADVPKLKNEDFKGLTHLYDKRTRQFHTQRVGSFYDFQKVNDEYGVSLIGYARIDKRDNNLCESIYDLYERGEFYCSFEITCEHLRMENGVQVIDACEGNELLAMAIVSVPAFPESVALDLVAEADGAEAFYENAMMMISEVMDVETIQDKFRIALFEREDKRLEFYRVLIFGVDSVLLYSTYEGLYFKVEYIIDGNDLIIKDFFEVEFKRKGSECEMDTDKNFAQNAETEVTNTEAEVKNAESEKEVTNAEAVDTSNAETQTVNSEKESDENKGEPEAKPEDKPKDDKLEDELMEAKRKCAELEAQLSELLVVKAELEQIKAEKLEAELNTKKENLRKYAIAEGLDVENEVVAEAINSLNYEQLVAQALEKKATAPTQRPNAFFVANVDINQKGRDYLFERSNGK